MKLENQLIESFIEINRFLAENQVRYCLIGGIAAGFWGEPRYTQDMDFTVVSQTGSLQALGLLFEKSGYKTESKGPSQMKVSAREKAGFRADFILAETEYQDWVVQRAVTVSLFGVTTRICTAEDLIILKMIASRRQDLLDIEKVLQRSDQTLDLNYTYKWLDIWEKREAFQEEFHSLLPK